MNANPYAKFVSETRIDRNVPREAMWNGSTIRGDITTVPGLPESLGFLLFDATPQPEQPAPEGSHYEPRYSVIDERVAETWVAVPDPPPPPRTFSKFKLKLAIANAGFLPQFEQMLAQVEVLPGYTGAAAFADAVTLDEDHPKFAAAVSLAKTEFGLTDEQVEAILAASVAE